MNFFEQQDRARQKTAWLVFLFIVALLCLVIASCFLIAGTFAYIEMAGSSTKVGAASFGLANVWDHLSVDQSAGVVIAVSSIVFLASFFKLTQMNAGGEAVANALGGRLINVSTHDLQEKILLNVVEEMAIASGVSVPPVYVLEEAGINAFAAGTRPHNAVIGITRGAVQQLERDELQGVVAHEFSHIFNGDMRLNMRLIGMLYGILVLGNIGFYLLRASSRSSLFRSRSNNNNTLPLLVLGGGLMVLGYAGTFFGNLIKSSVSRQREFLADASAVQFTRNTEGLSGALKKIGGFSRGSQVEHPGSKEISHLFFGQADTFFLNGLFATHPPLDERIRRIDRNWVFEKEQTTDERRPDQAAGTSAASSASNFAGMHQLGGVTAGVASALTEGLCDYDGEPNQQQRQYASHLLNGLPQSIMEAAHEPYGTRALMYCLLLSKNESVKKRQMILLAEKADPLVYQMTLHLQSELSLILQKSLAVFDLAMPAICQLSPQQSSHFLSIINDLIKVDGYISLYEWSLHAMLISRLGPKKNLKESLSGVSNIKVLGEALNKVISALAYTSIGAENVEEIAGFNDDQQAVIQKSHTAAKTILGLSNAKLIPIGDITAEKFEQALVQLRRLRPLQRPSLLKALVQAVASDGVIHTYEVQLVRAIAQYLDCPAPPLIVNRLN